MYSMALGPRFFKWKMLSLSGPKALLFLQNTLMENVSLVYLFLIKINLECSIIDVVYYDLVTEMQAAIAKISVSRSIYNKHSFHCHVIFPNTCIHIVSLTA